MTLLICPVRPGDNNEPLRYALRSWETNLHLAGGLNLLIVGHQPSWLVPDWHVQGNLQATAQANVWDNVYLASLEACQFGLGDTPAIYMNDDFFCLDPVTDVPVVRRNLTLAQHAALLTGPARDQWWTRSLDLTASWLSGEGYVYPWSYDLHRPLPAAPSAMIQALERWDGDLEGDTPQWRTVYGVLNEVEAYPVADVKLSRQITGFGTPWVSTDSGTWRVHRRFFENSFQKPSRWER